jgi:hypothetical protein
MRVIAGAALCTCDTFLIWLAPEQVPPISREFAQQLEFKGEYEQALAMYTRGREGGGRGASEAQTREPNMPSSYGMASF